MVILAQRLQSERIDRPATPPVKHVAKLSKATQVEIARRYQAGERPVDLALAFGISEWRVQELRKRFGLEKHPISMSNESIDKAAALYKEGLSFTKIGRRLGWDPKTIAKELRRRGIVPNG